ncbi:hypothetical protein HU200_006475 [Digitaria exilis]|uniref:Uncharacterized protein n=1 Tax=Digitaria exilis TaxID=1010633 RepID=A0A835KQJ4_9POAL|nr:hypothetical protein HU200_006475 [Digitaria exilis]
MDVPFFVAFSAILLVGRYLPFTLPVNVRDALAADNAAAPATRAAKCAISVAVAGLVLLVSMQCSSGEHGGHHRTQQCPAEVAMETRALWLNAVALFLGTLLGAVSMAMHPPARVSPVVEVVAEHLTRITETIAITAFAHDLCIFLKILNV